MTEKKFLNFGDLNLGLNLLLLLFKAYMNVLFLFYEGFLLSTACQCVKEIDLDLQSNLYFSLGDCHYLKL